MRRELMNPPYNFLSPVITLHDRPAEIFQPIVSVKQRQQFLQNFPETSIHTANIMAGDTKLVVSSTSWTPDENFEILLEALCSYASRSEPLPSIIAIITGKGPQKQFYCDRIANLHSTKKLRNVSIITCWLSAKAYAQLLACADLGVSMHVSSSGLDLPMKVVDMFGAGLPVLGYSAYESWGELVKEGENGIGFSCTEELGNVLYELFRDKSGKKLAMLKAGATRESRRGWDKEWDQVAGRIFGLCN